MHYTNDPLRWMKYLVLPVFKIRNYESLAQEIIRYEIKDINKLLEDLKKDIEESQNEFIYILRYISQKRLTHKNYKIVKYVNDLEEIKQAYNRDTIEKYSEIWVTKIDTQERITIGKVSFTYTFEEYTNQMIEIVWNQKKRLLNQYTRAEEDSYMKATRVSWATRYEIEETSNLNDDSITKKEIIQDLKNAVLEIERKKKEIDRFKDYVKKLKIPTFGLEFRIIGEKFEFIDFTSSDDSKIVSTLFGDQMSR